MSSMLSNEIKNHFDAILGITSRAKVYFHYYAGISDSLQSTTEEIHKICPVFWKDTTDLYYYSCVESLMLLYDFSDGSGGLITFLSDIKDQVQDSSLLKDIDNFLSKMNQDSFVALRDNLREIRNKKIFHIDKKNARGEYNSDKVKRILMLNKGEAPDTSDPDNRETIYLSPGQNGNLSALWFFHYKKINRFLSFPISPENSIELQNLQNDLKTGISVGDRRFSGVKLMCGNNEPGKNELEALLEETVAIVGKLCNYFGRDPANCSTESNRHLHLFDELQVLFSEEKLVERLHYVRDLKRYAKKLESKSSEVGSDFIFRVVSKFKQLLSIF